MNGIKYRTTYDITTPESAEQGDYADAGWIDEDGEYATFRELVDLLRGSEPSCYPLPAPECCEHVWYTADYGTDYRTGAEERRSYHPADERAGRYMAKAWAAANKPR